MSDGRDAVGVLLAGGLARRMGGGDKCLRPLAGKAILAHVVERVRPQVGPLMLNANGDPARFAKWKFEKLWEGRRTPLHTLREQGYKIDGELVTRWAPLGFDRDTAGDDIPAYFGQNQDQKWFFFAEPYPTHLPYNPPDEYYRMFLPPEWPTSSDAEKRLAVVRNFLIVHPSGVISKLEAGESDPLPDDDSDDAHKRTAGTVDLLPEDRPAVLALYDGEARVFDDLVGTWIRALEDLNLLDDTLIILTADHGEELMERGHVGHCSCNLKGTLYDESIRVPLIMRFPARLPAGRVVNRQVSHIDIMPTLFDLLELPSPPDMDGQSLLPVIGSETAPFREETFCETPPAGWQALARDKRDIWCLRTQQWKLIMNTESPTGLQTLELYDLVQDPGETESLTASRPDILAELLPKLEAHIAGAVQYDD